MKYKTLFRLSLKVVGIFLAVQGISDFLSRNAVGWIINSISFVGSLPPFWYQDLFAHMGFVFESLVGIYLFFGGKWIVNLAIPSNRPYCPECSYDLTAAASERCPECGTAFRWEDVRPKTSEGNRH